MTAIEDVAMPSVDATPHSTTTTTIDGAPVAATTSTTAMAAGPAPVVNAPALGVPPGTMMFGAPTSTSFTPPKGVLLLLAQCFIMLGSVILGTSLSQDVWWTYSIGLDFGLEYATLNGNTHCWHDCQGERIYYPNFCMLSYPLRDIGVSSHFCDNAKLVHDAIIATVLLGLVVSLFGFNLSSMASRNQIHRETSTGMIAIFSILQIVFVIMVTVVIGAMGSMSPTVPPPITGGVATGFNLCVTGAVFSYIGFLVSIIETFLISRRAGVVVTENWTAQADTGLNKVVFIPPFSPAQPQMQQLDATYVAVVPPVTMGSQLTAGYEMTENVGVVPLQPDAPSTEHQQYAAPPV